VQSLSTLDIPDGLDWDYEDYIKERIINVAPGIESDEIFVYVTSSTLPDGIPLGGSLPAPLAGTCCYYGPVPVLDLYCTESTTVLMATPLHFHSVISPMP
jgi:hypothetical protein